VVDKFSALVPADRIAAAEQIHSKFPNDMPGQATTVSKSQSSKGKVKDVLDAFSSLSQSEQKTAAAQIEKLR
jgi:hypothetical protein